MICLRRAAVSILCLAMLLAALCLPQPALRAEDNSPDIKSVRYGVHPGYFRIVVDATKPLDCEPGAGPGKELVISCAPFRWSAGETKPPASSLLLNLVPRNGPNGKAEIAGDAVGPLSIRQVFNVPARDGNMPRLVIDYGRAGEGSDDGAAIMADRPDEKPFDNMVAEVAREDTADGGAQDLVPRRKPDPAEEAVPVSAPKRDKPFTIVIDAGHGGADPGALAVNGVQEKEIVLAMARALRDALEADPAYRVRMTRDSDTFIKLGDRVKIARQYKADLFVSLHADSLPSKRAAAGASFYTISKKASDEQTAKLAERENKADLLGGINIEHEDKMVESILLDLITRDTINHSKFFATTLEKTYRRRDLDVLKPAHRSAGFAVLKAADIPSVLIELGFLSNPVEAKRLNDKAFRQKVANTLKAAIDSYVAEAGSGF